LVSVVSVARYLVAIGRENLKHKKNINIANILYAFTAKIPLKLIYDSYSEIF